jgi:N-hydroxyarylamine O-acetyltransferase
MDVNAYLKRINYDGPLSASAGTLRRLQVAHLFTVPFENLSIHAHEPIVLDDEALFAKIVERRRGGFCYEANGLFAALLRELGFDVAMLSAEVGRANSDFSPPFDHMALLVRLEQRWLVDVGFGDSALEPLQIDVRTDQIQGDDVFRVAREGEYFVLLRGIDDEWRPQYRFTLTPHEYADYAAMCRFHQTSPDSHFTQNRICSLATPQGRVTLSGMSLIVTSQAGRQEKTLATPEEYAEALREHFGISFE